MFIYLLLIYLFIYSVVYFRMVLFTTDRRQSKTAAIIDEQESMTYKQRFRLPVAVFLRLFDPPSTSVRVVFDNRLPG